MLKVSHNRNYSTGSILQLKEIDCNQIVNQKAKGNRDSDNSSQRFRLESGKAFKFNNYVSDKENSNNVKETKYFGKKKDVPKTLISVSDNVNNVKMIPAPLFKQKDEVKYENGIYCSSDSSSAATLGKCFL